MFLWKASKFIIFFSLVAGPTWWIATALDYGANFRSIFFSRNFGASMEDVCIKHFQPRNAAVLVTKKKMPWFYL